jgi:hypothetical protein
MKSCLSFSGVLLALGLLAGCAQQQSSIPSPGGVSIGQAPVKKQEVKPDSTTGMILSVGSCPIQLKLTSKDISSLCYTAVDKNQRRRVYLILKSEQNEVSQWAINCPYKPGENGFRIASHNEHWLSGNRNDDYSFESHFLDPISFRAIKKSIDQLNGGSSGAGQCPLEARGDNG